MPDFLIVSLANQTVHARDCQVVIVSDLGKNPMNRLIDLVAFVGREGFDETRLFGSLPSSYVRLVGDADSISKPV